MHEVPIEYYHCPTEGCKYSSSGWPAHKFIREDHVKAHIKWYGHYGPQSPGNRKKRKGSEFGKEFTVSVVFEKWNIGEHAQLHRRLISVIFTSPKTELWYKDEVGEQFLLLQVSSFFRHGKFFCLERNCYYHETPPANVPCIAFASSEYLEQHERRTRHSILDSSGETQSSLQVTPFSQELVSSAITPDLQPVYGFSYAAAGQEYSQSKSYYELQAGDGIPLYQEQLFPVSSITPTTRQVFALQAMGTCAESSSPDLYAGGVDYIAYNEMFDHNINGLDTPFNSPADTYEDRHVFPVWTSLEGSQLPVSTQESPSQQLDDMLVHHPPDGADDRLTYQNPCLANVSQYWVADSTEVEKLGSLKQDTSSTLVVPSSEFYNGSSITSLSSYAPIPAKEGE